ncbi:hypothetical protein Cst_c13540 [Thermoclostridium stercorarium subsp. stercorarium DSM 8532]|uniref:Uncharacterized protein n=1 Tax=Thermoclostridium stercorarium (strain ATCC 35414 / DSM 8532 / NCIMB 11754) TaxID=1121335 RepID=L7VJQ6_THES1|nr:hypothetical protein Cst_c13540 [Thermoclostridium stercorarium subsp. stercorarium DSM 8532]
MPVLQAALLFDRRNGNVMSFKTLKIKIKIKLLKTYFVE